MELELYTEVALRKDFPEYKLKVGDIATLVDVIPHPENHENGCILEVFNALGESVAIITVPASAITTLSSDEILTVRAFISAS